MYDRTSGLKLLSIPGICQSDEHFFQSQYLEAIARNIRFSIRTIKGAFFVRSLDPYHKLQ